MSKGATLILLSFLLLTLPLEAGEGSLDPDAAKENYAAGINVDGTPSDSSAEKNEADSYRNPCLDAQNYECFAKCNDFWGWCVDGDDGCFFYYVDDTCIDDYQVDQCCVHTLQSGLF